MFLETRERQPNGQMICGYVNSSEIVRILDEGEAAVAELRDGKSVTLAVEAHVAARATCPIIPAQPGFELLTAWFPPRPECGELSFTRAPIIGWRVKPSDFEPEPLVPVREQGSTLGWNRRAAIKYPDGLIHELDGPLDYADEAAWQAEMKDYYDDIRDEGTEAAE
jgi:hypothetical protein